MGFGLRLGVSVYKFALQKFDGFGYWRLGWGEGGGGGKGREVL